MTNITIPPEALKKSARSLARITHRNLSKIHTLTKTEDEFVEENWPAFVEHARAAFLAMIEAWPGVATYSAGINGPYPYIIIPLMEKHDDQ